jgi:hypothetical protein
MAFESKKRHRKRFGVCCRVGVCCEGEGKPRFKGHCNDFSFGLLSIPYQGFEVTAGRRHDSEKAPYVAKMPSKGHARAPQLPIDAPV